VKHEVIIHGDCLEEMRKMEPNSISAIVTDPPYGLHFMGKDWDEFSQLKIPTDKLHKKLFSGEFEFRDRFVPQINTANSCAGSYDPKRDDEFQNFIEKFGLEALRIAKPGGHILMFGSPRRHHRQVSGLEDAGWIIRDCLMWIFGSGFPKSHNHFGIDGFGTALKPAYEPIILAMKPCDGTFKENAEKWGQAGINIDGCRIGEEQRFNPPTTKGKTAALGSFENCIGIGSSVKGRWPANVIFDEEAAGMLGEPSRFFYCAKASSSERNQGLEDRISEQTTDGCIRTNPESARKYQANSAPRKNPHPTVKPLKLMEYLIKLVMPPKDGILLDPFAGSGTTILAARKLGYTAIGIEKEQSYCEIARARINHLHEKKG
jgi:site-specific DNA-methyltransferase (adenine-specific)